ncbi:hypothetical protein FBU31_007816, partial [Coemansia sp. 'formosensis']
IVSNEYYCTWIKWSETGDQIMIGNWDTLIDRLLDMNFSATKRKSIMEILYGYQFKLESDGRCPIPDDVGRAWSILRHEKFLRGCPDLLRDIKRAPPQRQR